MTTVTVNEDCNNPSKYLIISRSDATTESLLTTTVALSVGNQINVVEISKLKGDQGDPGPPGPQGPAGQNGLIFDTLAIASGGTNNTSFANNKIIYYDGNKLTSSSIDVNSIQTDIISNVLSGSGLTRSQDGNTVTLNANLGNGITLDGYNRIVIDNSVITTANFNLSSNYMRGKLDIPYGGTNNTFFASDKLIYFDGEKLNSLPLGTGDLVLNGMQISVVAGSGLVGGGNINLPNGSVVLNIPSSADILVTNDSIELSTIVNSGVYSKVSVDSKGRVINGAQLTLADMTNILGFTPWHAGNDGHNSGLDADLLDAQHGSYYRNATNITGVLDHASLPDIVNPGTANKITFNAQGLIVDSGLLNYLDITNGLGYIPFDSNGGTIYSDVEILGDLIADSGVFNTYSVDIGKYDSAITPRGVRFRYGDYPQKTAILAYYPQESVFKIVSEGSNGIILTRELADTKYVGITGYQEISGIKSFLQNTYFYGRVLMRSTTAGLPAFDVGTNNLLVNNLNADLLDNEHGFYYRNAANLTGILNEYVIIPHIEDYSTENYIPKFYRPSPEHPMVIADSIMYQETGTIYVHDGNLSVGINHVSPSVKGSAAIGSDNIISTSGTNSLAVGTENTVAKNNSVAFGTNAETWIDNQIAIGGFAHNKTATGINSVPERDAHGQLSYIPIKYHGTSPGWTNALSFVLPANKTLEYSAELLFTKQKETGVASFVITTGIVKNYGYRDPVTYTAYKKTIPVVQHSVSELYNNSQERSYVLNINISDDNDNETYLTDFTVTAPPLQYLPLDIEDSKNPTISEPISDHQVRLYAQRGTNSLTGYRKPYIVKLSPFSEYPYNTGNNVKINLGKNIGNITECLYFRTSGSKEGYIKFHKHGILTDCPIVQDIYTDNSAIATFVRKDSNFDFSLPQYIPVTGSKSFSIPANNKTYRQYLPKNLIGGISGSGYFDIYRVSGISDADVPSLTDVEYGGPDWSSVKYATLGFDFSIANLSPSERDWSKLNKDTLQMTVNRRNLNNWTMFGGGQFNVSGYINPNLGCVDFVLSNSSPFSGPTVPINGGSFSPNYYVNDESFQVVYNPFGYYKTLNDSFRVIDHDTIAFSEKQLGFVSGNNVTLLSYPHNWKHRIGRSGTISNQHLNLQINDTVQISGTNTIVTEIYNSNSEDTRYVLNYDFGTTGLFDVYLVNSISGIGFSSYRSFTSLTGTYVLDKSLNTTYTKYCSGSVSSLINGTGAVVSLNSALSDGSSYTSGIGNILSNYNKVAVSSILITSNGSNNFVLPELQLTNLTRIADNYSGINSNVLDIRVNGVRIFDSSVPVIFSGYNGSPITQHHVLISGDNTLYIAGGLDTDDCLSYRLLTTRDNNRESLVANIFTPDENYPSFQDNPVKLTRYSDYLLNNSVWTGVITVNNNVRLPFSFNPTGLAITSVPNFISNRNLYERQTLVTGLVSITPHNETEWADQAITIGESTCSISVVENSGYTDYGNLLTNDNRSTPAIIAGDKVIHSIVYEQLTLNFGSTSNTGVINVSVTGKQPYHTLSIDCGSYNELLRIIENNNSTKLHNNLNIGFNIANQKSGILNIDNLSNKFLTDINRYGKIYNVNSANHTFDIAVKSGELDSIATTGFVTLNHSKIYDLVPNSILETRNNRQLATFSFLNSNNLQSGIYPIVALSGDSVFIYDFDRSFSENGASGTGILHKNFEAYNITDSKFSIWGQNFYGDRIIYPFRDISAFIGDHYLSCASGKLCIKLSGVPNYVRQGDEFWIGMSIAIDEPYKSLIENDISGPQIIYDNIKPGIVSYLVNIPDYYSNPDNPYYNGWNSDSSVSSWKSAGSTGIAIMITGTENIQTDKRPNYNNTFLSVDQSISLDPSPSVYKTNSVPTGQLSGYPYTNITYHNGFNNILNKYLSDTSFSGIYSAYKGQAIVSTTTNLSNAADWTVNNETASETGVFVIRDLDTFKILGIDYIIDNTTGSLTYSSSGFDVSNLPQNSGITFRIGTVGGLGLSDSPPYVQISGVDSSYEISQTYMNGIVNGHPGLTSTLCPLGPVSHSWYSDISITGLNNTAYISIELRDTLDGVLKTKIFNKSPKPKDIALNNFTNTVYYDSSLTSPFVISFDIENVDSSSALGISGYFDANITTVSSGIQYTAGLKKWQAYVVANAVSTDLSIPFSVGITGDRTFIYPTSIIITGINSVYTTKITNAPSQILYNATGIEPITFYFNYQKIQPYSSDSATVSFNNLPSSASTTVTKIGTEYEQPTSRDLYQITISNVGPTGYNLLTTAAYNGNNDSFITEVVAYNPLSISNILSAEPLVFAGNNWKFDFDINGGGGANYAPDIQLLNTPSYYGVSKSYDESNYKWSIAVTGGKDKLGRYNLNSGIYNIQIYARDITSNISGAAQITYVVPPRLLNTQHYYGVKNKNYFINLNTNNPTNDFDPGYSLPNINAFMPSNQTLIYDKYNRYTNVNEVRYSGGKMLAKWDTRLQISNMQTQYPYDNPDNSVLTIDVKGLDTDVISVIGLLKLKELDVLSTDYPPLQIVNVIPEEQQEINQGEDWTLTFDVIGGLANANYPPTILLSGLPSVCSGYFPDQDPNGPVCLSSKSFSPNTDPKKWSFAFTGVSYCTTGIYPIEIKAFDTTGEDTHITSSYFFKPLAIPGPSIKPELDLSLYPNCQFFSGDIKYISSIRNGACPYATGINTINIIGSLPTGLYLKNLGGTGINGVGTGILSITGIPTHFPANNVYESFSVEVIDKAGKKAKSVITFNTSTISSMNRNPLGIAVFFPNSGYYLAYDSTTQKNEIASNNQLVYVPYPSTGSFNCRSVLTANNCPTVTTGLFQKFADSGLNVFIGTQTLTPGNVFAVFNNDFNDPYNGLYQLLSKGNYQPILHSGNLISFDNAAKFSTLSPTTGYIKYIPIDIQQKNLFNGVKIIANPSPAVGCNTCILGSGSLIDNKLVGKFRPSVIASISGNLYGEQSTSTSFGPLKNPIILSGVTISTLNNFASPEIHEICYSNCYESGSVFISGIVLPMPSLDISDLQNTWNNRGNIALATRCAFTDNYRDEASNRRALEFKYTIQDILSQQYFNDSSNTWGSPIVEKTKTPPNPINVNFPIVNSGTIYRIRMYRTSDKFPTYNPNSYDAMYYEAYIIHKASGENDEGPKVYPGLYPHSFGHSGARTLFPSTGIKVMSGEPFFIPAKIIGGDFQTSPMKDPTITSDFYVDNTGSIALDNNNNTHRIAMNYSGYINPGIGRVGITGLLTGLTGLFNQNYDLRVTIAENALLANPQTVSSNIPVTILVPLSLTVPTITNQQSSTKIYVNPSSKWTLSFDINGGDRPESFVVDKNSWVTNNLPVIEIDDNICGFDILSLTYNQNTNIWSTTLRSKNIVTATSTITLKVSDKIGSVSNVFDVEFN